MLKLNRGPTCCMANTSTSVKLIWPATSVAGNLNECIRKMALLRNTVDTDMNAAPTIPSPPTVSLRHNTATRLLG
jgi:hypothetical protein